MSEPQHFQPCDDCPCKADSHNLYVIAETLQRMECLLERLVECRCPEPKCEERKPECWRCRR